MTLWNKKWLVIATTLVTALGSLVFALNQPSIYKAEALLLPPKSKDIQSLNVLGVQKTGQDNLQELDTGSIFSSFKASLQSRVLQKKFINEFEILEILAGERTVETRDEEIYEMFANLF
ncbi:MAG: Wzz/FepE/Etk N-terminal domain-containing protein, partial [SAR324 cluster bacterium]|nr:Wzz/FepE/Etk N-terminal domain-containing protein [SAR324 cluster bacterium]